jgi:fatty-acyl-CoA synthase
MRLVERHRVTRLLAVPTIFNAVLNSRERPNHDLSSLKQLIIGGSPAAPALVRALEAEIGAEAIVGYGLTETSPIIALAQPRQVLTEAEPAARRIERQAMTGWAIPGVRLRVVDGEGRDVPAHGRQIGEIIVRGNTVMDGYYRDADATAATIRDGWLHTGDMAVVDEAGYLMIKDRSKDIIISAGENISSVEIEVALAAHPAVLECAVVAAPDSHRGEVPVAFVVLKPDATATATELRAYAREHLAAHKVPRRIDFRDALPKGGTGKILKAELREPLWAGLDARVQ